MMFQTLEATLDPQGKIHFTEDVHLKGVHQVLITLWNAWSRVSTLDKATPPAYWLSCGRTAYPTPCG